jgi:hypothetical protein
VRCAGANVTVIQCDHLRHHRCGGEALSDPRAGELARRSRQAAEHRREREGGHAGQEQAPVTEKITQAPSRDQA